VKEIESFLSKMLRGICVVGEICSGTKEKYIVQAAVYQVFEKMLWYKGIVKS
jgi:hypothetical protein